MKAFQYYWTAARGWHPQAPVAQPAQLVLAFASPVVLRDPERIRELRRSYPESLIVGCSTAGEICDVRVLEESLTVTAVQFERSRVAAQHVSLEDGPSSRAVGERLGRAIDPDRLVHVFVLSDGLHVNGSDLVQGLTSALPPRVSVTGGLSGDGDRFEETWVLAGDEPRPGVVSAVAFYGVHLHVGCASLGGWDSFGTERIVTKSTGNVLYELDGQSALSLYKHYLGKHAAELPASALLFPLALRGEPGQPPLVRTVLSIDEDEESMTFAGDLPEGAYARLMKANFDRLVEGAAGAARAAAKALPASSQLAILISGVGRKMALKQRIEEEVDAVRQVLGRGPVVTGFYSYGEISPFTPTARCELHNQTMTITAMAESAS